MRKRREDPVFIQKEKEYLKQYCDKNRKEVWEIIYNSNPKPRVEYTEEGKKAKAEQLEALKKYKAELVMCECGQEYRRDGISRHRKTELHTKRLNDTTVTPPSTDQHVNTDQHINTTNQQTKAN